MKSKCIFVFSWIAAVVVASWLGSRALPVRGDTPSKNNKPDEQSLTDGLKANNQKLDKILEILQSIDIKGNHPKVMVEITLPEEIQKILSVHVRRGKDREVLAGELHRNDFTADELVQLDALVKEKSGKEIAFESAVNSECGDCDTGASKGYRQWISFPGGGGFYACFTCNP
jgi:hypothetical protein